jgi:hypothetical protein
MSFPDANGNLQGFETLTDTTFGVGTTSLVVTVQAMNTGTAANGCSGSGNLDSSTPITFITGLSMAASSNGGVDAEDDQTYLNRLATLMTTLTPSPITSQDFSTIAMSQPGVGRAFTLSTFNPETWSTTCNTVSGVATLSSVGTLGDIPVGAPISGPGIPTGAFVLGVVAGPALSISAPATATATGISLNVTGKTNQGGSVTSWVVDATGAVLSSPAMAAIQATIQAMCLGGVVYTVLAPTETAVNVDATVVAWADPNNPTTAVHDAVVAAITAFLTPTAFGKLGAFALGSSWLNETVVRIAALQTVVMNVPGVHYATITINGSGSDYPLPGVVPLPTPGTITASVTTG